MSDKGFNQFLGAVLIAALLFYYVPFLEEYRWIAGIAIFIVGIHLIVKEDED
jgi:energy-converting hydrogenase Eha subunit B